AARALVAEGARAMTDVTGFGLAGHLLAICEASGVAAEVILSQVPLHAGAAELAAAGVRSTIFPANREALSARVFRSETPLSDLAFDPQTAGGLLAAVPEPAAAHAVETI